MMVLGLSIITFGAGCLSFLLMVVSSRSASHLVEMVLSMMEYVKDKMIKQGKRSKKPQNSSLPNPFRCWCAFLI